MSNLEFYFIDIIILLFYVLLLGYFLFIIFICYIKSLRFVIFQQPFHIFFLSMKIIFSLIRKYPSNWTFGSWGKATGFSPSGDGINRVWMPPALFYLNWVPLINMLDWVYFWVQWLSHPTQWFDNQYSRSILFRRHLIINFFNNIFPEIVLILLDK